MLWTDGTGHIWNADRVLLYFKFCVMECDLFKLERQKRV